MAFTDMEKTQIVTVLGWPGTTVMVGGLAYNKGVNDRLTSITASIETLARAKLTAITAVDAKIDKVQNSAGIKSVDDIEFFEGGLDTIRGERRKLINELGELLDIPNVKTAGVLSVGV